MRYFQDDDYPEIYRVDVTDQWINSAYDENGNGVVCDRCGTGMRWKPEEMIWYCPDCGQEMDRPTYFNYIGAEPPTSECITNCCENYPFCKKYCERFEIDPDDPMLT